MSDGQTCGHPRDGKDPCGSGIGLCERCGKCWVHCIHVSDEERAEARLKGGEATAARHGSRRGVDPPKRLQTIDDALLWFECLTRESMDPNGLPAKRLHAGCRALELWVETRKDSDAMEEVKELRERLEEFRSRSELEVA